MTASNIKEWVRSDEGEKEDKKPEWMESQPEEVQDYLYGYYRSTIANNKQKTLENRATPLKQFVQWYRGNLLEVEPYDIEDWRDDLVARDYGYRSVRQKVYAISPFYNRLQDRDIIRKNPVDRVEIDHYEKTKQEENLDREYVNKDEFELMLDACETTRERLICLIFWDTGLRVGEAVDVKLGDINERNRAISVETSKTRKMEQDEERTVYYSHKMDNVLTEWVDGDRNSYFGSSGPYLLVSREAEQMYTGTVSDILRDISDRAGVRKEMYTDKSGRTRYWPHPHALRKSYGVYRTERGMPIAYLSDLMGHSDIETTKDKYLKFRDDDIKEADRRYRPTL